MFVKELESFLINQDREAELSVYVNGKLYPLLFADNYGNGCIELSCGNEPIIDMAMEPPENIKIIKHGRLDFAADNALEKLKPVKDKKPKPTAKKEKIIELKEEDIVSKKPAKRTIKEPAGKSTIPKKVVKKAVKEVSAKKVKN